MKNKGLLICTISLLLFCFVSFSQQKAAAKGKAERIKVHGKFLEGNLSGDPADRYVSVYLPAGYNTSSSRRYPVVYFLHGYTDDDAKFYGDKKHWMKLPPVLDSAFASGSVREMIVVTPDAFTQFQGSMYSNSITTGDWEDFVATELVAYIDAHYRTLAAVESRGLCGHSMGGYGALRIGEKHPEIFGAVYLLSPCCLNSSPVSAQTIPPNFLRADSIKTVSEFEKTDFGTKIVFASAAAWSPNPTQPPFYLDLPVRDGKLQPTVLQKWEANRPLNSLDQYIVNLKKLKGIGFDAGAQDKAIAASIETLDAELDKYRIKHSFEIYEGNHTNRIAERIGKKMLSFFSENLRFEQVKK